MKKLVLMAVAIVAVSFASCGNKAADAAKAQQDSIRIADSIAAVEAAAAEAEQAAAQAAVLPEAAPAIRPEIIQAPRQRPGRRKPTLPIRIHTAWRCAAQLKFLPNLQAMIR